MKTPTTEVEQGWNVKSHKAAKFLPKDNLLKMTKDSWKNLDEEKFNPLFNESAVQRTGFSGLKRNIGFL